MRRHLFVLGAGNLEIIVAVNGRNVPNYVQSEGNARFKVCLYNNKDDKCFFSVVIIIN